MRPTPAQLLLFWINTTVPAYPLDGSRILVNALSLCGVGLETAAMTVALLCLLSGAMLFMCSPPAPRPPLRQGGPAAHTLLALMLR